MRSPKILLAAVIAMVSSTASAADGSTAYNFLNIPMSSRIYGLGGVNITLVNDDVNTIDQNPALLGGEMSGQVSLNYMRYVGESNFAGVRYAHIAGEHGAWSAAINYLDYGEINEMDETGNQLGSFKPKDACFSVAYSHDIADRLRGGISLKGVYSTYAEYSAFAVATDLGINYYDEESDMSLSVVVANLGGQVKKFNDTHDKLPVDIRLGWSQTFGTLPLRFSVTAWNLTKWHLPHLDYGDGTSSSEPKMKDTFSSNLFRHLVFGVDIVSSPNWYLGVGYNYKTRTDMSSYHRNALSGLSLSGGLDVSKFGVGIALAQPHSGATTFMLNLNLKM